MHVNHHKYHRMHIANKHNEYIHTYRIVTFAYMYTTHSHGSSQIYTGGYTVRPVCREHQFDFYTNTDMEQLIDCIVGNGSWTVAVGLSPTTPGEKWRIASHTYLIRILLINY